MRPDVSILLPTIRPGLAGRALGSIAAACVGLSYEVIVVADFPEPAPAPCLHMTWIQSDRRGVVDAVNRAEQQATGAYWFTFNDESVLEPGAIAALYREASPLEILTPRHVPPFRFEYYGRPFPPFPFVDRELLRVLGGLLDPAYRAFYADPDLGMRADKMGIPVRVVDDAVIHHANNHDANHWQAVDAYLNADRATFRSRWDHLGTFEDP
jgi:GT2 family glycosyltransferase